MLFIPMSCQQVHIVGMERLNHIDQLRTLSPELCEALHTIRPEEQRTVRFATEIGEQSLVLSCSAMQFKSVVLPQPLEPSTAINSPFVAEKFTPLRAFSFSSL